MSAYAQLPPPHYDPVREAKINHAGKIDKLAFQVSVGVLYGAAIISVLVRFAIRLFGRRRRIRLDDVFVLIGACTCTVAVGISYSYLDSLYLVEAMNHDKTIIPNRDEITGLLDVTKWSAIQIAMVWTTVFMIKFAFMHFFKVLIWQLSKKVTVFYWTVIGILIVCWLFMCTELFIICSHFGAEASICSANFNHDKSVGINVLGSVLDIICDILIMAVPLVVLQKSHMPFSQKVGVASMLCLSSVMVALALVRIAGAVTETKKDSKGTAPVWATYWCLIEACVAVIMASVIIIRSVFITNMVHEDRRKEDSMLHRLGRRLVSTLRLSGSSRSSRRSPGHSGASHPVDDYGPRIPTQGLTKGTMTGLRTFISGGKKRDREDLESVDTAYILEELDYHKMRKQEAAAL